MDTPFTMRFDSFWGWLISHPNCILRAGTPEAVIYDDDDLHWHFASEPPRMLLVQVLRGKRLIGEVLLDPEQVSYVEAIPQERAEEHVFEVISESESERFASYFFVLAHGFDEEEEGVTPGRVH